MWNYWISVALEFIVVAAISILGLERHTVAFSATELGSAVEFWGPDVVPDDGADVANSTQSRSIRSIHIDILHTLHTHLAALAQYP